MASSEPGPSEILRIAGLGKSFPGIRALDDVSFAAGRGEVLGLVGENGAGKSTLIKILSGVYQRYDGALFIDGQERVFASAREAQDAGVATIYQELTLVPTLTVAENVFLGRELVTGPLDVTRRGEMRRRTREATHQLGVSIDPDQPAGELSIAAQQLVEICKALVLDSRIVVMDEPTSSLSHHEVELLFKVIKLMREQGRTVIYVSHKLDEVFAICDRVAVMRDGKLISDKPIEETTPDRGVADMVGRDLKDVFPERQPHIGEPLLTISGLSRRGEFSGMDLVVHAGEILALSGLVGAGRTELAKAIVGATVADGGTVELAGHRPHRYRHPGQSMADGVVYLSEDRKGEGLLIDHSIRENIVLSILRRLARFGFIRRGEERAVAKDSIAELRIKARDAEAPAASLSGGNQQKVAIARLLATKANVFLLDEPTRGVDVGAKSEIYRIIRELTRAGRGVLLISSELPEVLGLADRIALISDGRLLDVIDHRDANAELVMNRLAGGQA